VDYTIPVAANLTHCFQSQISGGETIQQLIPDAINVLRTDAPNLAKQLVGTNAKVNSACPG
jgi:hypothetical protein